MARGGFRVGAGRKKKSALEPGGTSKPPKAKREEAPKVPGDVLRAALSSGESPVAYMLRVMRNGEADQARRDRMAIAAAPFCHPRMEPVGQGKREEREAAAKDAAADKYAPPSAPKLVVNNG